MKRSIIAALLLLATIPVWADFKAGQDAFQRGDYTTALNEWRPLAESGDPEAQLNLGFIYSYGLGVVQDYGEAAKWLFRAARQNQAEAQSSLGTAYFHGQGVPQDYNQALKWYRQAAAQNDGSAIFGLASMYAKGLGVKRDYQRAFRLGLKAANMNDIGAQFLVAQLYSVGLGVKKDDVQALMWFGVAASRANNLPSHFPEQALGKEAEAASRLLMNRMTEEEIGKASRLIREWKP